MDHLEEKNLVEKIVKLERVTIEMQEKYFKGKDFNEIRNWLENNDIDRHITLELKASAVPILINISGKQSKLLVQVRSTEKCRMGFFGGGTENDETPIESAMRELKEEAQIEITENDLEFIEINEHDLKYENGDNVHYFSYVYLLRINEYPVIKIDNESNGVILISKDNVKEFTYINDNNVLQMHKYWWKTIDKILEI